MRQHAQGDLADQLVIDAVCMTVRSRGRHWPGWTPRPGISCSATHGRSCGMRNRIAHGYLLVNTDIVRRTLQHDIPPIMARIDAELADAG